MSAEAAGWDWLQIIGAAGAIAGIFAIFLHYADKPGQVEHWVERDREYRAELAGKLRGARIGATYRDLLTRGLAGPALGLAGFRPGSRHLHHHRPVLRLRRVLSRLGRGRPLAEWGIAIARMFG